MKKIFKTTAILFVSISLLTISSCKKEEDKPTPAPTEKTKLTNKDFKLTDANITFNGVSIFGYSDIDACSKDDLTKFLDDLTGTIDEGPTKCDPSDPQQTSFTWSLVSSDKQLRIDDDGDITVYDIKINNGTTLKIEFNDVDNDYTGDGLNDDVFISQTFTKQ